jgi:predicted ABC-type ATPase
LTAQARPTLVLLAGPNGAGKSTLFKQRVAPTLKAPFINADVIQRDELKDVRVEAAYDAARIASERRDDHLTRGVSFATETVFSHPSKLALIEDAKARGFRVMVFHVGVADAALSVARVAGRVEEGGHAVPEEKIRARYARGGALIRQAVLLANVGHVFDNSGLNTPPERVLSFLNGRLNHVRPDLPEWARAIYAGDLKR